MDMFTGCVHIMASCSDGDPLSVWIFLGESADFDGCMSCHSGDFFTIDGFDGCEDFLYKRGVCIGEIDRGFVAKLPAHFIKLGEYFLFHWFDASRDICTDEVAPLECTIYQFHLAEVP